MIGATRRAALVRALCGTDARLYRMLQYWAATALLYLVCVVLLMLQVLAGVSGPAPAIALAAYGVSGVLVFYLLVRLSARLGIAPGTLAVLQGLFGISCNMALYLISGPLRAASLIMLLVVVTFCTFAMRPRQTFLLATVALGGMAALMWWRVRGDPVAYPANIEALTFAFMAAGLLTITVLTGEMNKLRAHLRRQKEELLAAVSTIRTLATVDELTSLANRRHMHELLEHEQRRQGQDSVTCIALVDIDFFKRVNDEFGHAGGDAVLRAFAAAACAELRAGDVLARWGGEEFLLLLPAATLADGNQVLARMAGRVGAMAVPGLDGLARVSFSAGLAARLPDEPFADTIGRADRALYQAKAAGRDCIVTA